VPQSALRHKVLCGKKRASPAALRNKVLCVKKRANRAGTLCATKYAAGQAERMPLPHKVCQVCGRPRQFFDARRRPRAYTRVYTAAHTYAAVCNSV